jgi:hypothetical protein
LPAFGDEDESVIAYSGFVVGGVRSGLAASLSLDIAT